MDKEKDAVDKNNSVRTQEDTQRVQQVLKQNSRKSLKRLSQQLDLGTSQNKYMKMFDIKMLQAIFAAGKAKKLLFCLSFFFWRKILQYGEALRYSNDA
jgi:hypothetical protein